MEDRLRQSQKMDALGQLTGGIAHDFNNLLTGITGSLDLIQVRLNSGRTDDLERFMRAARTAAHRAAALTHRLLVFARQQPLDPKPVDVNELIAGMEELLRRTLHERIRLNLVLSAHRWCAMTDAHQLENAILNLVINARDAMPDGGELRITTEDCTVYPDDDAVRSDRLEAGDYVRVGVTDTGTGIPPEVLAKVFEPFFTTKPTGKGTGLGLSMIYGFARQTKGDVTISSEVGRGTTVRLSLPRAEYPPMTPVDRRAATSSLPGKGESIFVVEDDATVRYLLGEVLSELGYRKVEAQDGLAALSILRSDLHIDLLVTDLGLPFVNGRQLADVARELRPGLKILFITGYVENDLLEKAQGERQTWILHKPVGLELLATKLREILDMRGAQ
jgi:CheY-like chemotaxis protein/two-component sensor histidine kinase